tara:strand:+ start:582 stop:1010 length:429 start_codon:yes stop_codon:yes gene_type:complete
MKTKNFKTNEVDKKWHLIDAENKTLGRLSSRVSLILMGKNKSQYTPNNDLGDFVVIINAEKIKLTGNKEFQKKYFRHSGYPGGLKSTTLQDLRKDKPEQIIYKAVKGMLPKNKLSDKMISKLKVYKGSNHPHLGQKPQLLES